MKTTREQIMLHALLLFSRNGYKATTMRQLAEQLRITPGALYRHFSGKQAILQAIIHYCKHSEQQFLQQHAPIMFYQSFGRTQLQPKELRQLTLTTVHRWTCDPILCNFRRFLTQEQYHSPQMHMLYQRYFGRGALQFLASFFRRNGHPDPEIAAAAYYAPCFLLFSRFDAGEDLDALIHQLEQLLP